MIAITHNVSGVYDVESANTNFNYEEHKINLNKQSDGKFLLRRQVLLRH